MMKEILLLVHSAVAYLYNYTHNVNQLYRIPAGYDRNQFPDNIVEVHLGYHYFNLRFLDLPSMAFGVKHIVHLKWVDTRLAWNASQVEMTVLQSDQISF